MIRCLILQTLWTPGTSFQILNTPNCALSPPRRHTITHQHATIQVLGDARGDACRRSRAKTGRDCGRAKRRGGERSRFRGRRAGRCVAEFISQKVFLQLLCKSECPHKSFNLTFITTNINKKLTDLCGNGLVQNDVINTFCEIGVLMEHSRTFLES